MSAGKGWHDRRARAAVAALFAVGLIHSSVGAVQTTPPAVSDEEIVVTGAPANESEIRRRVAIFLRETGVASGQTPAARWIEPVCPRVLGLSAEGTRAVTDGMRAIAEEAGIRIARQPCDSNIVVTFTADAGGLVREINRRAPGRLSNVPAGARTALLRGGAPIRWWYVTETRGRHGARAGSAPQAVSTPSVVDGGAGESILGNSILHYESSIISTLTNRALIGASVVVDQDDVMGMRLSDLTAYAALVAFAEIRSGDAAPAGSILGMFASRAPEPGLTAQDKAFLRALYRMPLDRDASRHRGMLTGAMVDDAKARNSAEN
jgi:hypothetical protein